MSFYRQAEKLLATYTLEEILEANDVEEVDLLYMLLRDRCILVFPGPPPVDMYDDEE